MRRLTLPALATGAALLLGALSVPVAHAAAEPFTLTTEKTATWVGVSANVTATSAISTLRLTFPAELPAGLEGADWDWQVDDTTVAKGTVPDDATVIDIPVPHAASNPPSKSAYNELTISNTTDHFYQAFITLGLRISGTGGAATVPYTMSLLKGNDGSNGVSDTYGLTGGSPTVSAGSTVKVLARPGFFTHGPDGTWTNPTPAYLTDYYNNGDCSNVCLQFNDEYGTAKVSADGSYITFKAPDYHAERRWSGDLIDVFVNKDDDQPMDSGPPFYEVGFQVPLHVVPTLKTTNTAAPKISGTPQVGKTLAVDQGTWSPVPTSYAYQWYRAGTAITGATKSTYTPVAADLGQKLTARVTAVHDGYDNASYTAAATATVIAGTAPKATTAPGISGTVQVGKTLTVDQGTWSPAATSYGYQWYRSGTAITGATKSTYTLTASDKDKKMTVKVTAKKTGYTSGTATTTATAAVKAGAAPKATTAPSISGTKKVGSTLTANHGTWSPAPTSYAYQWYRNGKAITGATKSTYKLTTSDRGRDITVKVTAKKTGYTSGTATTKAVRIS